MKLVTVLMERWYTFSTARDTYLQAQNCSNHKNLDGTKFKYFTYIAESGDLQAQNLDWNFGRDIRVGDSFCRVSHFSSEF